MPQIHKKSEHGVSLCSARSRQQDSVSGVDRDDSRNTVDLPGFQSLPGQTSDMYLMAQVF